MSRLKTLLDELCPDGVEYKKFKEVCQYIRGVTYNKSQEARPGDVEPWKILRANNITLEDNVLNFDDVKLVRREVKVKETQKLKSGDILICAGSGSREHVGKVAYIFDDMDYTFGGFMAVIRCAEALNSRFLFHLLTGNSFKRYLESALNSTTINNLNASVIGNFLIPIPPLAVQCEIVRLLDNFAELTAELTAELSLRRTQYEHYRDTLLTFDGAPGDTSMRQAGRLSDAVRWLRLGEIFDVRNGYTPSKKNPEFWKDGTIPWFRMEDIRENGRILKDSIQHITTKGVKGKGLFPKDSIIISTTATIGEHAILEVDGLTNQQITCLTIKREYRNQILPKYVFYYGYNIGQWCRENVNKSGGLAIIPTKKIKEMQIPVPPLAEQERIVSILDRFDALTNDMSSGLPAEIDARRKQYAYYRDRLLTFREKRA